MGTSWKEAACKHEVNPNIFFTDHRKDIEEAKKICARCSIREGCLSEGLRSVDIYGIWGGMTAKEIRRMKRKKKNAIMRQAS